MWRKENKSESSSAVLPFRVVRGGDTQPAPEGAALLAGHCRLLSAGGRMDAGNHLAQLSPKPLDSGNGPRRRPDSFQETRRDISLRENTPVSMGTRMFTVGHPGPQCHP